MTQSLLEKAEKINKQSKPSSGVSLLDKAGTSNNQEVKDDGNFLKDFSTGFAKQIVSTGIDIAEAVRIDPVRSPSGRVLFGREPLPDFSEELRAASSAEKVGKTAGFLAELAIPVGGVAKVGQKILRGAKNTKSLLVRALRPSKKSFQRFNDSTPKALEEVVKVNPNIKNIEELNSAVDIAKQRTWNAVQNRIGDSKNVLVEGKPIYENILKVVKENKKIFFENPELAKSVMNVARRYKKAKFTVPEAEQLLQESNLFLRSIYEKSPIVNNIPNLGLKQKIDLKIAESLRINIDTAVKNATGEGVKDLKKTYGALDEFGKAVKDRLPIEQRAAQFNLAEQLTFPEAMGDILRSTLNLRLGDAAQGILRAIATRKIKAMNDTNNLIEKVFKNLNQ